MLCTHAPVRAFLFVFTVSFLTGLAAPPAGALPLLYGVSADDTLLRKIDAATANTVSSVNMTHGGGGTIQAANGLARDPVTGTLYALVKLQGQSGRELVTVDPNTGVATSIGDTGDNFAGLAWHTNTGTLYGVTGDGADIPSALFSLSLIDATPTPVLTLGNGGSGETIGVTGGVLYHASGQLGDEVFESVDVGGGTTTNIPLSGDPYDEAGALTSDGAGNLFLADVFGTDLFTITTAGVVTLIGDLGYSRPRGLALVPEPGTGLLLTLGLTALASRRARARARTNRRTA